jgi:U3 small nucleolar RNA-associated protein 20
MAHHAGLSAVLARLLFPKLRKRTGRLGGRGAPGSARAAILNFLAAAPPAESRPLLELFLEPLAGAFRQSAGPGLDISPPQPAAADDARCAAAGPKKGKTSGDEDWC